MGNIFAFLALNWYWPLAVIGTAALGIFLYLSIVLKAKKDRADITRYSQEQFWRGRYHALMTRGLNGMDRVLLPSEFDKPATDLNRAWHWHLWQFCLGLAFFYPILTLLGSWVITGQESQIGSVKVLESQESPFRRIILLVLLGVLVFSGYNLGKAKTKKAKLIWGISFLVAVAVAVAVAGAGAGAAAIIYLYLIEKSRWRHVAAFGFPIAYLLILFMGLRIWGQAENLDENRRSLLLFWFLLPMINAMFDYVSLGMTRYFLRRGLAEGGKPVFWSVVDLLAALIAFAALGCAMILVLHYLRFSDGTQLYDLEAIFRDIWRNPQNYIWLAITLFSTLIPTLLHFCVMLFSLIDFTPKSMAGRIVKRLSDKGYSDMPAVLTLTGLITMMVVVPIVGLLFVGINLTIHGDNIAWWVFLQFDAFHQMLP